MRKNILKHIGAIVSAKRKENHLTQQQLAEITGIQQADISRLENGTGNLSLRTLKRLAAGMQLKLEFVPKIVR